MFNSAQEFWQAVQSGKISKDDFFKAMKAFGSSSDTIPDQFTGYQDKSTWRQDMASAMDQYRNSPGAKDYMSQMLKDKAGDRFVKAYKPFFNTLLQGADIATSLSQISNANKAVKSLIQPSIPSSPGVDPALNNAIYKAQQGTFDTTRVAAPIRQAANDQFQTNRNNAAIVSGGQAGEYGSRVQSAANDRFRAMGVIPTMQDQVRQREQARLDQLIGARANYNQQDFGNRLQGTQMAMDQYNRNVQTASALGAQGRTNLRNVFQTLPDNFSRAVGYATSGTGNQDESNPGYNTEPANFADRMSSYGQQVQDNLVQHMLRMKNNPNFANITPYQ